jgi:hypothetical protein
MSVGESEHLLGEGLIATDGFAAGDAESGCRNHHLHRRLSKVKLVDQSRCAFSLGHDQGNRGSRPRHKQRPLPNLRQALELALVRHHHKVPTLAISRGRCPSPRLKNPFDVFLRYRVGSEFADLSSRCDCVPVIHPRTVASAAWQCRSTGGERQASGVGEQTADRADPGWAGW